MIYAEVAFNGRADTAAATVDGGVFSYLSQRISVACAAQDALGNARGEGRGKDLFLPRDDACLGRHAWRGEYCWCCQCHCYRRGRRGVLDVDVGTVCYDP